MNTRILQTLSTAFFGACGIVGLFAPEVLMGAISMANVTPHWPVQILAAAFLALAMFNWMTRGFTMGGIYGRPVLMTNFMFYFVAALSTVRPVLVAWGAADRVMTREEGRRLSAAFPQRQVHHRR